MDNRETTEAEPAARARRGRRGRVAGALLAALAAGEAAAQELEPRAYSASPLGTQFVLLAYSRSTGSVVVDPSLPIEDVRAELDAATLAYGRTFSLLGRLASLGVALPYVRGTVTGEVFEAARRADRSGLADARLRFAWHLLGNPALAPAEFAQRAPERVVGASLVVVPPTGQYDPQKLVNLGGNRWAFKPELGLSQPVGRWTFDLYAGAWLFTTNHDFFGGAEREQEPIATVQGHVAYTFRPRLWAAVDATFYRGGETTIDGVQKRDLQENSRFGVTVSLPLRRSNSLKLAWTRGLTTRVGGDFDTLHVGLQHVWFGSGQSR